ncbi:MAG: hypothetical protein CK424_06535 [Legionella sp.]|nr:MAG: hypothetical protein CK424_06535 [Legionella sp.]
MLLATKRAYYLPRLVCGIFLIMMSQALAAISMLDLLTYDPIESNLIVRLQVSSTAFSMNLKAVQLHFLTSNDCQSGYMKRFDTPPQGDVFLIDANTSFGLRGESVYQAAASVIGEGDLEQVRSILLRLFTDKQRFLYFKGSCNDQGLNCCIPVTCSHSSGLCQPKITLETQIIYQYY